jgi:Family of unknown function (DUF6452)
MAFIMKKFFYLIFFFLLITVWYGCERDEICVKENTPRLIIKFYDKDDPTKTKSVPNLGVRVVGEEDFYSDPGNLKSPDSIVVPLEVTKDKTIIELVMNGTDLDPDNDESNFIEINSERQDEFISQSCGFKTVYNNVVFTLDQSKSWISYLEAANIPQSIIDEKRRHLKVYH